MITKRHPAVPNAREMGQVEVFRRRQARQYQSIWLNVLDRVAAMTSAELPPLRLTGNGSRCHATGSGPIRTRGALVEGASGAVVALAEELQLPVENLIAPDALRQLLWQPASPASRRSTSSWPGWASGPGSGS